MTIVEFTKFMNFAAAAIQDAVNSCPDLKKDRYVTLHVSCDGKFTSWNNNPDEDDKDTPVLHYYKTDLEEEEGWTSY